MKLFAITVTYNGLKWLDKCFGSLTSSSIPVKVITIDNASNDGTPEYIRKHFPEVDLIENTQNLGFGQANNIGIRKAYDSGADYVFLLNQDAWVEKDTIEKLVEVAEKYPEYGIVSPMHLNGEGNALDFWFSEHIKPTNCPNLYSDLYLGNHKKTPYVTNSVNAAGWLLSRLCIKKVGGFNPLFFVYAEDYDYIRRVNYHNLKVGVYPFAKIYHDREERKKIKTEDPRVVFFRKLIFKFCDPNTLEDIQVEIRNQRKFLIKSILKLNYKAFCEHFRNLKEIYVLAEKVRLSKEVSKKTGLSFL